MPPNFEAELVSRRRKIANSATIDSIFVFEINGQRIQALKRSDTCKYLGIRFCGDGWAKVQTEERLRSLLDRLKAVPMKPQQRMWALRIKFIPRIMYQLVLGQVTADT